MDDYWKASGNAEIAARVTKEQEERKAKAASVLRRSTAPSAP